MSVAEAEIVLRNCAVVDAVHGDVIEGTAVRIVGGRITEIGPGTGAGRRPGRDGDVTIVDLDGAHVMPGLWDVHCHLSQMIPDPRAHSRFDTEAEATIRAGRHAMDALQVGFTSLRVCGEVNGIDLRWRAAFANGMFRGPRLFCAGRRLSSTGGHGRQSRLVPLHLDQPTAAFDGEFEAAARAREQIHAGADFLKVAITGGMSIHEAMNEPHVSSDELGAIVAVARAKGRRVAVHAGGGAITTAAVRLGIHSVEHGYVLDEECVALMAENGTAYVPTIGVTNDPDFGRRHEWSRATLEKAEEASGPHRRSLEMAIHYGVRISTGGDKFPIADSGRREIELLAELGLGHAGAVRAATLDAAWLCGVDRDLGTVEVGKIADLLVVGGNPLEDVGAIRDLQLVIKGGCVVADRRGRSLVEPVEGAGVSAVGEPLPPLAPEPSVSPCCGA